MLGDRLVRLVGEPLEGGLLVVAEELIVGDSPLVLEFFDGGRAGLQAGEHRESQGQQSQYMLHG